MILLTLFSLSFFSSTLLPGGSEVYLSYVLLNYEYTFFSVIGIATIGNTLGGFSNWLIGFFCNYFLLEKKLKTKRYDRASLLIQKKGAPILLLSWLPVIGDPLCIAAGIFKVNWLQALLYILLGKFIRYTFLGFLIVSVDSSVYSLNVMR